MTKLLLKGQIRMRPLIISALAATLLGCTSSAPQQAQQASLYSATDAPQMDSNTGANAEKVIHAKTEHPQHLSNANSCTNTANVSAPKMHTSSRVQPDDKSSTSFNAQSTAAAKTQTQQTTQPDSKSDAVLTKAMSAIAAKMQNSVSVELVEMKRAEKNVPGKSIDTICGDVRGKSAAGLDTGDRPFLYPV